jgi:hypothetical protein
MRGRLANGSAAAAILAAGLSCFVFGLVTTLEHTLGAVRDALTLYRPVGSHSGTTALAVAVWLVAWLVLDRRWRSVQVDFGRVFAGALVLIALGCLGTFPPFYEAVGSLGAALRAAVIS